MKFVSRYLRGRITGHRFATRLNEYGAETRKGKPWNHDRIVGSHQKRPLSSMASQPPFGAEIEGAQRNSTL
jgi:hypothetical protein